MLIAIALTSIFTLLSALHWWWALADASLGRSVVVPEVDGRPAFTPGRTTTATVAVLLLLAALVCAAQASLFGLPGSRLTRGGVWVLLVLFALRAIGDLRWVGLFKRVRGTAFARLDSWLYTPLCLVISALCGLLLYTTRP